MSRFDRELVSFNMKTIGYRNPEFPTLGIAIANALNCLLGTGKEYSPENQENMAEEICCGMTMTSVSVNYETENRKYIHKDYLNTQESVKALIADAADGAILVINSAEGITSDIREQVELAKQAGIAYLAVFVDNCDLAEDYEDLENLGDEVRELLDMCGYCGEDTTIVYGSAKAALDDPAGEWGEKLLEMMEEIDDSIPDPESDTDKSFLMPVEDVFSITGRGIVATGRVETGVVKLNDRVEIVGFGGNGKTAVVTGIEMFRRLMDFAEPGDNIGLLLRGVDKTDIKRGQILAKAGTHKASDQFKAVVYFSDAKMLEQMADREEMELGVRTALLRGAICVSKDSVNSNGQYAQVTVELPEPVAMNEGMFFAVRNVGIGRIVEVL